MGAVASMVGVRDDLVMRFCIDYFVELEIIPKVLPISGSLLGLACRGIKGGHFREQALDEVFYTEADYENRVCESHFRIAAGIIGRSSSRTDGIQG